MIFGPKRTHLRQTRFFFTKKQYNSDVPLGFFHCAIQNYEDNQELSFHCAIQSGSRGLFLVLSLGSLHCVKFLKNSKSASKVMTTLTGPKWCIGPNNNFLGKSGIFNISIVFLNCIKIFKKSLEKVSRKLKISKILLSSKPSK